MFKIFFLILFLANYTVNAGSISCTIPTGDSLEAEKNYNLAEEYSRQGKFDSALIFYEKALVIFEEKKYFYIELK